MIILSALPTNMTASDYCTIISTIGQQIVNIGVIVIIIFQIKNRKAGDPPIDTTEQLGVLKGTMSQISTRLTNQGHQINSVAQAVPTPVAKVEPIPTPPIEDVNEDTIVK